MKLTRKCHNHKVRLSRGTNRRRRRNKQWQNKCHIWTTEPQTKKLQQMNHLGTVSRKTMGGGVKPVLLALTLCVSNFRRHLLFAFFFINKLGKILMQPRKLQCCKWRDTIKTKLRFSWFCVFFVFNGNPFGICKVERLNGKQRRSRWDGSLWAVSSGSMLFAEAYCYRLSQWKS